MNASPAAGLGAARESPFAPFRVSSFRYQWPADLATSWASQMELLILGWGSTYGSIRSAVERLQAEGQSVAHAHLRYLNPFPRNLGEVLGSYRRVLVAELNLGQLSLLLRAKYLIDIHSHTQVRGLPFRAAELAAVMQEVIDSVDGARTPTTDLDGGTQ